MKPPQSVRDRLAAEGYTLPSNECWYGTPDRMSAYMHRCGEVFMVTVAIVTGEAIVEVLTSLRSFRIPLSTKESP